MKTFISVSLALVLLIGLVTFGYAQGFTARDGILAGKQQIQTAMNQGNFTLALQARALFERITADEEYGWLAHYYAAFTTMIAMDYRDRSRYALSDEEQLEYIDYALEHLDECLEQREDWPEALAMRSGCLGRKSGLKPITAMITGPQSGMAISKALELEPNNPRVLMTRGISLHNTPAMWGGDREEAMHVLEEAIRQFELENVEDPVLPSWGHEEAWTWLGIGRLDSGDTEGARNAWEHALEINPDFSWVRDVLLPGITENEE